MNTIGDNKVRERSEGHSKKVGCPLTMLTDS